MAIKIHWQKKKRQVLAEMAELIEWFQPERMVYTTLGNKDMQVYFVCLPGLETGSSNLSYDGEDCYN